MTTLCHFHTSGQFQLCSRRGPWKVTASLFLFHQCLPATLTKESSWVWDFVLGDVFPWHLQTLHTVSWHPAQLTRGQTPSDSCPSAGDLLPLAALRFSLLLGVPESHCYGARNGPVFLPLSWRSLGTFSLRARVFVPEGCYLVTYCLSALSVLFYWSSIEKY